MNKVQKIITGSVIGAAALLLNACVSEMAAVNSAAELGPNDIAIVGKIEIVPPLDKYDQSGLKTLGSGKFKNKVQIVFDTKKPDPDNPKPEYSDNIAQVPLGEMFVLRHRKAPATYYLGGYILTESQATYSGYQGRNATINVGTILVPGGIKYHTNNKTNALYIGTIRYYRDDYNAITKVRVINQYKAANREFRKRTGAKFNLKRVKTTGFKMKLLNPMGG
jgi:hypothetical protein